MTHPSTLATLSASVSPSEPLIFSPALIPYIPLIILAVTILVCFAAIYRSEDAYTRLALSTVPILAAAFTCQPRVWTVVGVSGTLICLVFLILAHMTAKRYAGRLPPTNDTAKALSVILTILIVAASAFSLIAVIDNTIWAAGQTYPSTFEALIRPWLFAIALITFSPLGMVILRSIIDSEDRASRRIVPMVAAFGISALGTLIIAMVIAVAVRLAL